MKDPGAENLGWLARLVLVCGILLIVAGVGWYGVTFATIKRIWQQLLERPDEPMAFRFVLQPLMAAIAAFFDGRKDAGAGRLPYFWAVISNRQHRVGRLREGLNATARIVTLGLMDLIYQLIVLKRFYPVEAVIVAIVLGFVPYVVLRGIVTRIAYGWRASNPSQLK
ncbi:MAG: hypothetical protein ACJ8AW_07870 [Rhodopila sp.]